MLWMGGGLGEGFGEGFWLGSRIRSIHRDIWGARLQERHYEAKSFSASEKREFPAPN